MPIFEYQCRQCGREFEYLAMGKDTPVCPECESSEVCKLMSTCGFVTKGAGGQTISSSASATSCSGCTATNCSSCGH